MDFHSAHLRRSIMATDDVYANIQRRLLSDHVLCDVNEKNEVVGTYPLRKVNVNDLEKLRSNGKPGLILKYSVIKGYPEYWYTEIPKSFSLVSKKWFHHSCSECKLLGTAEAANLKVCVWAKSIKQAQQFENFEYIDVAIETFNTMKYKLPPVLKIRECGHFVPYPPRVITPLPVGVRKKNALLLAQFLDASLTTVEDLKEYEDKHLRGIV